MSNFWKPLFTTTFAITTGSFSFIPDEFFSDFHSWTCLPDYWSTLANRVIFFCLVCIITALCILVWRYFRRKLVLRGQNYRIIVEYGDILKQSKYQKVINFDECFTTELGNAPHQIKLTSLCGQFLQKHPDINIPSLISEEKIKPTRKHSEYNNTLCYEPGSTLRYNDYLLMAFSKLDSNGRASMSREDYLTCLNTLWKEVNKNFTQKDVVIPVLGAGLTCFNGEILSQQQLVDMIIASYKLNPYKIKLPNSLRIICKKNDEFSLNKIGENL